MARVINTTRRTALAEETEFARSPWARFRGLMLRAKRDFGKGRALVIDPCSSIHMFFMRFPIDVLYLDRENRVVRAQQGIRPWRIGPLYTRGAKFVIELPEGTIQATGTQVGDQILIERPAH